MLAQEVERHNMQQLIRNAIAKEIESQMLHNQLSSSIKLMNSIAQHNLHSRVNAYVGHNIQRKGSSSQECRESRVLINRLCRYTPQASCRVVVSLQIIRNEI